MEIKEIKKRIVLAGGGGHALSIVETLPLSEFAGYLALDPSQNMPLPWLGDDTDVASLAAYGHPFHMAFVYAGLPVMDKRKRLIKQYEQAGAKFTAIIAPTAIVTPRSEVGQGTAILHRTVVNRATLGKNVVVNTGAIVEHDCIIGSNTFIGPGAVIGGGVTIGDDCFIGLGAKVKNGLKIVSGVTVAMGATVTRDLLEPGIYHGTPLRRYKIR